MGYEVQSRAIVWWPPRISEPKGSARPNWRPWCHDASSRYKDEYQRGQGSILDWALPPQSKVPTSYSFPNATLTVLRRRSGRAELTRKRTCNPSSRPPYSNTARMIAQGTWNNIPSLEIRPWQDWSTSRIIQPTDHRPEDV
jgi:hypothetical protein